jgi:hypothetical protein
MRSLTVWFATCAGFVAWTLNLLLSYWIHDAGCDTHFGPIDLALHAVTGAAVVVTIGGGWASWRAWQRHPADEVGPVLSPASRSAFMGLAGLGLSLLFLIAIAYHELTVFFLHPCT